MARKGDLAVMHLRHTSTSAEGLAFRDAFEVGTVLRADRHGRVLVVETLYGTPHKADAYDVQRVITEARELVDVPAVIAAAKAHHYPGYPKQPMPYDTLAEVIAMALPHRTGAPQ